MALTARYRNVLWIFVSGGDRPAEEWLPKELRSSEKIWFSGIYGRENQFQAWLAHWATRSFAHEAFAETKEALFSGRTGLGPTANRLRQNLLPVIILLEAYQAMVVRNSTDQSIPKTPVAIVDRANTWLADSLSQLWETKRVFPALSSDAALLYGAIKNWTPAGRRSQARLTDLLKDFLPSPGFHADYDPAFDESIRHLIFGRIDRSKIDQTVNYWCHKLSELSILLETMPNNDHTFNS